MFVPASSSRIWLYTQPVDMRKSFLGLMTLAKNALHQDPLSGHYFVFVSRRKTQMKILYFDPAGFCLWSKKLEQGCFHVDAASVDQRSLSATELQWLIDGIEVKKYRQYKRYCHLKSVKNG